MRTREPEWEIAKNAPLRYVFMNMAATIISLAIKVADNTTLLENRFSAIESGITYENE